MFAAHFVHLESVFKLSYVIRYLSVLANVAGRIIAITARAIIFHDVDWLVFVICLELSHCVVSGLTMRAER